MGSCCSAEIDQKAEDGAGEVQVSSPITASVNLPSSSDLAISQSTLAPFIQSLEAGLEMFILTPTGKALFITLKLQRQDEEGLDLKHAFLNIVSEIGETKHKRDVRLDDIRRILWTPDHLGRIEIRADLDKKCVGILQKTGTCLTLRFNSSEEATNFVKTMELLRGKM